MVRSEGTVQAEAFVMTAIELQHAKFQDGIRAIRELYGNMPGELSGGIEEHISSMEEAVTILSALAFSHNLPSPEGEVKKLAAELKRASLETWRGKFISAFAKSKLTQEQFSKKLGRTQAFISMILTPGGKPVSDTMRQSIEDELREHWVDA